MGDQRVIGSGIVCVCGGGGGEREREREREREKDRSTLNRYVRDRGCWMGDQGTHTYRRECVDS
jgi:hypothetical protein